MSCSINFYLAKKGRLIDKLIGLKSVFSHVEIEIDGMSYSSSNRDGGVRAKEIKYRPQKWLKFELKKDIDVNTILNYFNAVKGQEYDYLNILLTQILKLNIHNKNKQICSEFVANCFKLEDAHKYNPEKLFFKLKEMEVI